MGKGTKWATVSLAGLIAMSAVIPATAHDDVTISICIPYYRGSRCAERGSAPSYIYGQDVPVKGRINRSHSGTVRVQRRQRRQPWRTVARVALVQRRYRYVWHTTRDDADQGTPYKFRAVLARHDHSRTQKVYVLFRE